MLVGGVFSWHGRTDRRTDNCILGLGLVSFKDQGHGQKYQKYVFFFAFALPYSGGCGSSHPDAFSSILPSPLDRLQFESKYKMNWHCWNSAYKQTLAAGEFKFSFPTLFRLLLSGRHAPPARHISSETFVNFHWRTFGGDLSITACQYFTFHMTLPFYEVISSHLSNFHLLPK